MTPVGPTRTLSSLVREWAPHLRIITNDRDEAERAMDRVSAEQGLEVWPFDIDGHQVRRAPSP